MANATKAPLSKKKTGVTISKEDAFLATEYDANKKYMFQLAVENSEREHPVIDMVTKRPAPHKKFMPFRNIVFTSQIVWNGQRKMIRYYDGCDSIFVDQQPKEKETIEQLIKQSRQRVFEDGKFGCFGDEKQLLQYMNACSWNTESPFRTRTADSVFLPVNADKAASQESEKLDRIELALQYAREATTNKMLIHANYLGVAVVDYDSGNELTEKEIRTAYRREASRNPEHFIESYGNTSIEIRYYIDKAWEKGIITNSFNPNQATWSNSNSIICDISGLKSGEAICQRLFEFSQNEVGEEFVLQLKAISE